MIIIDLNIAKMTNCVLIRFSWRPWLARLLECIVFNDILQATVWTMTSIMCTISHGVKVVVMQPTLFTAQRKIWTVNCTATMWRNIPKINGRSFNIHIK